MSDRRKRTHYAQPRGAGFPPVPAARNCQRDLQLPEFEHRAHGLEARATSTSKVAKRTHSRSAGPCTERSKSENEANGCRASRRMNDNTATDASRICC